MPRQVSTKAQSSIQIGQGLQYGSNSNLNKENKDKIMKKGEVPGDKFGGQVAQFASRKGAYLSNNSSCNLQTSQTFQSQSICKSDVSSSRTIETMQMKIYKYGIAQLNEKVTAAIMRSRVQNAFDCIKGQMIIEQKLEGAKKLKDFINKKIL